MIVKLANIKLTPENRLDLLQASAIINYVLVGGLVTKQPPPPTGPSPPSILGVVIAELCFKRNWLLNELSLSYTCGLSKDLSSSLSTKTSLVCHMPDWLLLLSASQDLCFIFLRGNSAADSVCLERCKKLYESLKPEPVSFCEVASPVEPMVDLNTLRNKGRRVGIQAATITTFCSILDWKLAQLVNRCG